MTKGVQDRMLAVERIRDAFQTAIYGEPDLDAALALVTDDCTLTTIPAGTGTGTLSGRSEVRRYLAEDLVPNLPADLTFHRLSRTGDRWRVAQEDMVSFTHDRELPWLLPGVTPTQRHLQVLAISVVTVHRSQIASHRTLWDRTALLGQLGVVPARR